MRAARWSAVALAVVFLAGCGQAHRQSHGQMLHLTAEDNGKEFTVNPHETIVVTLAFNRRPGYRWQFVPGSSPTKPLRLVSHRYVAPRRSVPGAPGKEIWRFRAVSKGALRLGFVFRQPRQKVPARRFNTTIRVR